MEKEQPESDFSHQLGERLCAIRKRAKLSLRAVARKIARESKTYYTLLHRLERGKIARPSITLIAKYLAACGATFSDILEVLNTVTTPASEPAIKATPAIQAASEDLAEPLRTEVRQIDQRLTRLKPEESLKQRLNRIRRMTKNRILRTLLEDTLYDIITSEQAKGIEYEKLARLCQYGRKIFAIHLRTRTRPERRMRLLELERDRSKGLNLPEEGVVTVEDAIRELYHELKKQGLLDEELKQLPIPPGLKNIPLPAPVRAEKRLLLARQRLRIEREREKAGAGIAIFLEMNKELKLENLDNRLRGWAMDFINRLFNTAVRFDSAPEQRQRQLSQLVENSQHPDLASRLLDLFEKTYPRYRHLALPDKTQPQEKP